jgi:hypothetical protein
VSDEPRPRRLSRRQATLRVLVLVIALAAAFVGGIGLGEALHDTPKAGGIQTLIRTLHPLPLAPIAGQTVTITTSRP